uniref:Uncharacterized protein n=1 Tax=Arion vulgaris TaxID=1028688 RepID=A0A0B7AIU9_9EUPU
MVCFSTRFRFHLFTQMKNYQVAQNDNSNIQSNIATPYLMFIQNVLKMNSKWLT